MILYLQLFLSFMQIGFTSFGGLSMVPLINQEMLSHGWMTAAEVSDLVAIAEMTPGPLGLNIATFCGLRLAGLPGSFAATMGMLSPTFTVCVLVGIFYEKFRSSTVMKHAMYGIRPVCIGLILSVMITLSQTNYLINGAPYLTSIFIAVVVLVLMIRCKLSIPVLIAISAVLGLLLVR
ncbi:MAG: chromate transporter [Clostridiales bacterium]|nr:chromate transporter [Clostridiales bacterium]